MSTTAGRKKPKKGAAAEPGEDSLAQSALATTQDAKLDMLNTALTTNTSSNVDLTRAIKAQTRVMSGGSVVLDKNSTPPPSPPTPTQIRAAETEKQYNRRGTMDFK
jgi:hypothetical protein